MTDLESLKYPIGRFSYPRPLDEIEIQEAINSIDELPALLRVAVKGMSETQLNTPTGRKGGP